MTRRCGQGLAKKSMHARRQAWGPQHPPCQEAREGATRMERPCCSRAAMVVGILLTKESC